MRPGLVALLVAPAIAGCGDMEAGPCAPLEAGSYLVTPRQIDGDCVETESFVSVLPEGGIPYLGGFEGCTGTVTPSDDRCEATFDRACEGGVLGWRGSTRVLSTTRAELTYTYWQVAHDGFQECTSTERAAFVRQ